MSLRPVALVWLGRWSALAVALEEP